jgi:hypothetical protein
MVMWQHTFGVYVWHSVWRCKVDCSMYGVLCGDVRWTAYVLSVFKCLTTNVID